MSSVNTVHLLGWTGKDPDIKATNSGTTIAKFTIAVKETYKNKQGEKVERTEWFGITCFGGLADVVKTYVKKGMQVFVEGYLKHEEWEKEGTKHRKLEIYANKVHFLTKAQDSTDSTDPTNNEHTPEEETREY